MQILHKVAGRYGTTNEIDANAYNTFQSDIAAELSKLQGEVWSAIAFNPAGMLNERFRYISNGRYTIDLTVDLRQKVDTQKVQVGFAWRDMTDGKDWLKDWVGYNERQTLKFEINASIKRGVKAIAKDISRRLLKVCLGAVEGAIISWQKWKGCVTTAEDNTKKLAVILGGTPHRPQQVYEYVKTPGKSLGSRVIADVYDKEANLEIDGISIDLAEKILQLIADEAAKSIPAVTTPKKSRKPRTRKSTPKAPVMPAAIAA